MASVTDYSESVGQDEETRISRVSRIDGMTPGDSCLVTIYGGTDLGRQYRLDHESATRIGRGHDNDIVLDMDNVSRYHAVVESGDDGFVVRDNKSTNGTYVNGTEVGETGRLLQSGDQIKIGGTILKFLHGGNVEALFHEEIYRMTIVDGLTQIFNKRYFLEFLDREMARCARYDRPLALLLFDIDHFKQVNDTFGHLAGDAVLKRLAELICRHIRKEECFARYGGEEFAIIMPETNGERARIFAEKIRTIVERSRFHYEDRTIPVTVSIGIGEMTDQHDPPGFIADADAMLYSAKQNGRNRIEGGTPA